METETPEFIAQAVKYYRAVLESKKKSWRSKHPLARRGRPRKVVPEGVGGGGVPPENAASGEAVKAT